MYDSDEEVEPEGQLMDRTRIKHLAASLGRDLSDEQLDQAMVDMRAGSDERLVTMEAFHRWYDRLGGDGLYDNADSSDAEWKPPKVEARRPVWRSSALTSYKVPEPTTTTIHRRDLPEKAGNSTDEQQHLQPDARGEKGRPTETTPLASHGQIVRNPNRARAKAAQSRRGCGQMQVLVTVMAMACIVVGLASFHRNNLAAGGPDLSAEAAAADPGLASNDLERPDDLMAPQWNPGEPSPSAAAAAAVEVPPPEGDARYAFDKPGEAASVSPEDAFGSEDVVASNTTVLAAPVQPEDEGQGDEEASLATLVHREMGLPSRR